MRDTASSPVPGGGFLLPEPVQTPVFTPEDVTEEQRELARGAEAFMRREVLPRTAEIYAQATSGDWSLTRSLLRLAGEQGLLGLEIPEAYGGLELSKVTSVIVGEQFAIDPSFASSIGVHSNIGTLPILHFGNEAQKRHYLPRMAAGELIGAYALTEPHSGSDSLAAKTKAELSADGRHYILNGQKMWITNGGFADVFTVFARVDGSRFTAFLVERGPGVENGREEKKLGIDGSSTTTLTLTDCRVPVENVLGEVGRGHRIAFNVLNIGRLKLGARALGSIKIALGQSVGYATVRTQFGRPIAEFGLIQQKLAEMAVRAWVGESALYRTLGMVDAALGRVDPADSEGVFKAIEQYAVECSMVKVWATEALAVAVDEEVQVFGGYGFSREYPAERAYRDARISRIYEGTNEINRIVITTQLLKRAGAGLPLLEAARRLLAGEGQAAIDALSGGPAASATSGDPDALAAETRLLGRAKAMALMALGAVAEAYGDKAREEQECLGLVAEMAMDVYTLESALLRARRLIDARGADAVSVPLDITRLYARDAAARVARAALQVLTETAADDNVLASRLATLQALTLVSPFKAVAARRRIARAVIDAGGYRW